MPCTEDYTNISSHNNGVFHKLAVSNERRYYCSKNFTFSANFDLLVPDILTLPLTKGSVDKPAKIPGFKFPGSAIISPFIHSAGQLSTSQQDLLCLLDDLFRDRRNSSCRSVFAGMFLHPCSKLCIVLGETHKRRASSLWVLPK